MRSSRPRRSGLLRSLDTPAGCGCAGVAVASVSPRGTARPRPPRSHLRLDCGAPLGMAGARLDERGSARLHARRLVDGDARHARRAVNAPRGCCPGNYRCRHDCRRGHCSPAPAYSLCCVRLLRSPCGRRDRLGSRTDRRGNLRSVRRSRMDRPRAVPVFRCPARARRQIWFGQRRRGRGITSRMGRLASLHRASARRPECARSARCRRRRGRLRLRRTWRRSGHPDLHARAALNRFPDVLADRLRCRLAGSALDARGTHPRPRRRPHERHSQRVPVARFGSLPDRWLAGNARPRPRSGSLGRCGRSPARPRDGVTCPGGLHARRLPR